MADTVRPTKKQRELLTFIERFISEHGYSPSYREIMTGLDYSSVATVALHINNLVKRGHVRKRQHSARSLEVTAPTDNHEVPVNTIMPSEEKWLVSKIEYFFTNTENSGEVMQEDIDRLYVLVGALRIFDLEGAAQSFVPRLAALKKLIGHTKQA